MTVGDPIETVAAAAKHATEADSVHDAFHRMLRTIQRPFGLWHAVLVRFVGPVRVRTEEVWAPGGSPLEPGMELDCSITPDVERIARAIHAGRSILTPMAGTDLGLLSEVLDLGGTKAIASLPVRSGDHVTGAVCLASSAEDALDDEALRLLNAMVGAASQALIPEGARA